MATEIVEIVIREKGGKATSRQIKNVGRTSGSVAKKIGALVAALGVLAGIRGFLGVAKAAIDTSAAFEQYGVRLAGLLGSQEEANKALDTFTKLASKTPFAVSQIVEGAATLGAVALGNRERLEELTLTAANLAAATGLSFKETAGNLQRALSAGIAAADQFRDRGVRGLIESIVGIPDATKIPIEELEAAFQKAFGEGGTFGNAAENLSKTLGGALSNVDDATTNVKKALGDAFRGPVINSLREVLLPFLTDLETLIIDNEGAIQSFAKDGLNVAIQLFGVLVKAGVETLKILNKMRSFGAVFQGIIGEAKIETLTEGIADARANMEVAFRRGDIAGGLRLEARIDEKTAELERMKQTVGGLADEFRLSEAEAAEFAETLDQFSDTADRLISGAAISGEAPRLDAGVKLPTKEELEAFAAQEVAAQKLLELNKEITLETRRRKDPINAAIFLLGEEANELIKVAEASGNVAGATEGVRQIQEQILLLQQKQTEEAAKTAEATRAAEAAAATKAEKAATKAAADAKKAGENLARDISGALESSFGSAIRGAIEGEGFDAMGLLAKTGADLLDDALSKVFDELGKSFAGLLSEGGPLSGLGPSIGAGLTAGIGAALSFIPGAIADTEASITNSLVKSAAGVTQAEAQRGVIAGNTSLPIFQVGESMEAALAETESKLDLSNEFLGAILEAVRSGQGGVASGGGVGQSSSDDLSRSSQLLT